MASDYYPKTEQGRANFLDNLLTQLATVGTTVGMDAPAVTALGSQRAAYRAAVADKVAKKALAQAATATCAAMDKGMEDTVRAHVRRIKAHAAYTTTIGRQLGIEVDASAATILASAPVRPDLEAVSVLHGEVELTFEKNGYTGVEIESQRGAETAWTFLARDTDAPYVDTRPNLGEGPETRRYRARHLDKDCPTGEYSDVLVVTVPARA